MTIGDFPKRIFKTYFLSLLCLGRWFCDSARLQRDPRHHHPHPAHPYHGDCHLHNHHRHHHGGDAGNLSDDLGEGGDVHGDDLQPDPEADGRQGGHLGKQVPQLYLIFRGFTLSQYSGIELMKRVST